MTRRGHHYERALIDHGGIGIKFADDVVRQRMALRGTAVAIHEHCSQADRLTHPMGMPTVVDR
jgi:hypothetical protein